MAALALGKLNEQAHKDLRASWILIKGILTRPKMLSIAFFVLLPLTWATEAIHHKLVLPSTFILDTAVCLPLAVIIVYVAHLAKSRVMIAGAWLFLCGFFSNTLVMALNGGCMPVSGVSPDELWGYYILTTETARLVFLSDVIGVGFSVGDIFIVGGLVIVGVMATRITNKLKVRLADINQ